MHVFLITSLLFVSSQLLAMDQNPMDTTDDDSTSSLTRQIAVLAVVQRTRPMAIPQNREASRQFSFSSLGYPSRSTTPDTSERRSSPFSSCIGTPSHTTPSEVESDFGQDDTVVTRSQSLCSRRSSLSEKESQEALRSAYWEFPGQQASPAYHALHQAPAARSASVSAFSRPLRNGCLEIYPK